ncbi:hypothetical protein PT974_09864 [Cladobotryum mycophilum]|uniref:Uncharacterized protein n=1 Tax=Cladobotryum mycophilum TaxID=491253 RepID=A0ABR0SHU2_9HYPO
MTKQIQARTFYRIFCFKRRDVSLRILASAERNRSNQLQSGLSLSGVVMSTIYRLFDLDYRIFVISDNVVELPLSQHEDVVRILLDTLIPKMNLRTVSLDETLEMLQLS